MILSGPDSSDTVVLDNPILNDLASDNGRTIAFNSSKSGKHDEIWSMRTDGSGARRLTGSGDLKQEYMDRNVASWGPVFSPDGLRILFSSVRSGNAEIYVMEADGSAVERLTDDPSQNMFASWMP